MQDLVLAERYPEGVTVGDIHEDPRNNLFHCEIPKW